MGGTTAFSGIVVPEKYGAKKLIEIYRIAPYLSNIVAVSS